MSYPPDPKMILRYSTENLQFTQVYQNWTEDCPKIKIAMLPDLICAAILDGGGVKKDEI